MADKSDDFDTEAKAIRAMLDALEPLSHPAQDRVLSYVVQRVSAQREDYRLREALQGSGSLVTSGQVPLGSAVGISGLR